MMSKETERVKSRFMVSLISPGRIDYRCLETLEMIVGKTKMNIIHI